MKLFIKNKNHKIATNFPLLLLQKEQSLVLEKNGYK